MRLSSKTLQLFGATIIALITLATIVIATPTKTSTIPSFHATNTHSAASYQQSHDTVDALHSRATFEEDHFALRTNHFHMPQPTLYAIAALTGYGPAIRRARIRRKGSLQG
jgi:hypothetical protein